MDNVLPIDLKQALLLLKEAREEANSANRNSTVLAGILRVLLDNFWPKQAVTIPYSEIDNRKRELVVDCFEHSLRISTQEVQEDEQMGPVPPGTNPA